MFATLLGALPLAGPPGQRDRDADVHDALALQLDAGLEPVTDGEARWDAPFEAIAGLDGVERGRFVRPPSWRSPLTVDAWRFAAEASGVAVKQSLPGPYTVGRRLARGEFDREAVTLAVAEALAAELAALADAGCPLVEIHEPDVCLIEDDVERSIFRSASARLLFGTGGRIPHVSLAISGGSAHAAGAATLFDLPFASYAFDLRRGPDNWDLISDAPPERGIVVGAMPVDEGSDDGPELLVWAAHYAASTRGRGLDRVGLAPAGSLRHLSWNAAAAKVRRLGEAARIAARESFAEIAPLLDPRAVGMKSAAAGRFVPPDRRRARRR